MRATYDYTYYRPRHKRYSYMTGNDVKYTYGTSGNETGRFLFWTEDCYGCEHRLCLSNVVSNRMHAAVDEKYSSYYVYDHSGERTLKLTGKNTVLDVNAELLVTSSTLDEVTLYPSPYVVVTNKGYTKHYYVGGDRLCARIGGGGIPDIIEDNEIYGVAESLFQDCVSQSKDRILYGDDLECIFGLVGDDEPLRQEISETPTKLDATPEIDLSSFKSTMAYCASHNDPEDEVYYYHGDHLGSASWISDANGVPVQHLQYLPFGERYINQCAAGSTYNERFTFTGKERDEETGYGYFGARYMDHELMTMWLSVDPMADKYPSISPYAYCAWNPVKLVDPNGEEIDVSYLDESTRTRLINCLSTITGLSLYIEGNKLYYKKYKDGQPVFSSGSQTARMDLIDAIDKKNKDESNYVIQVGNSAVKCEGGQTQDQKGGLVYLYCSKMRAEEDALTNGLGMIFLHELRHAVTGEDDPVESGCDYNSFNDPHSLKTGPIVDRVNQYRRELGMPIRIQYVARNDGKVPFLDIKYDITRKNIRNHVIWKKLNSERDD